MVGDVTLMGRPKVSVVIPTYKRGRLLSHVFEGLKNQSFSDFEVIVILRPSDDCTKDVIAEHSKSLGIKLFLQYKGHFTDALNIGLQNASGEILLFLDDDAIPFRDLIQNHVELYTDVDVGGVAGDVIPVRLSENNPLIGEQASEIIPEFEPFLEKTGLKLWYCPIPGLETSLVYLSKAGNVEYNAAVGCYAKRQTTKSLLGMGANMSVLAKSVKDFSFSESWMLGLGNEQFMAWHIWKKGHKLLFNPNAKVYHIAHGQTLSRDIVDRQKEILRWAEYSLFFYRLYGLERNLSKMHRIVWFAFSTFCCLKNLVVEKDFSEVAKLEGNVLGNIIGLKWLLYRTLGLNYNPIHDLESIIKK